MNKVLLIDNDPGLLEVLDTILSHRGFDVTIGSVQTDIITQAFFHQPDLVIINFLMKNINGGELCSSLKKNISTKHIPVIILAEHDHTSCCLADYGHDLYLPKQIDFSLLIYKMKNLLYRQSEGYGYE